MRCAWEAYLKLLPHWLREKVDKLGRESLQELRLRVCRPPELVVNTGSVFLERNVTPDDLNYCVNAASQYSPWSAATSVNGFITAAGGHRLGLCGDVVVKNGKIGTITNLTSICIRVARDFPEIAQNAAQIVGSVLIIGSPGSGKTTFLRDLIRQKSEKGQGAVALVDERREVFPVVSGSFCFPPGRRTEVMSGCRKADGIEMLIRTMNPRWIAVDEITAQEDCEAMIHAGRCGVSILATAHAENLQDYLKRPVYKQLNSHGIFSNIIIMQPDKSWILERKNL